jgi:lantibiotic transport system permease protein
MIAKVKLLRLVITTELMKARNTVALWLTLLYPLGSVFLASLFHYAERSHVNPDMVVFINNFNGLSSFFLPFYAVLMVSFFCQLEHRNSMLKHLYSLPLPRWAFFYGKLIACFILIAAAWVLMIIILYISMGLLGLVSPKLRLTAEFSHGYLLMITGRSFLATVALVVIQYLLSMKLRNVVASVTIGITLIILPIAVLFVLGITGLITNPNVLNWVSKYDPYSFPYSFVFNISQGGGIKQDFFSTSLLVWFLAGVIIAALGYLELKNRNIK